MNTVTATPTFYCGVKMRSRLEADFAAWKFGLYPKGRGPKWVYEPYAFAGPAGQWLPDFGIYYEGWREYVEVKPGRFLVEGLRSRRVDDVLDRMAVAWLSQPNAWLRLVFWEYRSRASLDAFHVDCVGIPGPQVWVLMIPGCDEVLCRRADRRDGWVRDHAHRKNGGNR